MSDRRWNKLAMLAKIEATYGTDFAARSPIMAHVLI